MKQYSKLLINIACVTTMSCALYNIAYADDVNDGTGYSYFYKDDSVSQVITKFAKDSGLELRFSGGMKQKLDSKQLSGRFNSKQKYDLVNQLSRVYGFNWFVYSGALYITNNNMTSKSVNVSVDNMSSIKTALMSKGLLIDKFGYAELPRENKVIISGPTEYVNLVTTYLSSLKVAPTDEQFAVFRLKYASANDIILSFNNTVSNAALSTSSNMNQLVIPGVATILQNLVQAGGNSSGGSNSPYSSQVQEVMSNGLNSNGKVNISGTNNPPSSTTSSGDANAPTPSIQADWRLNTIVIRDKASNMKMYSNLIKSLDVPAPLIAVEVLIVNLNEDAINEQGISWWAGPIGVGYNTKNLSSPAGNDLVVAYNNLSSNQQVLVNNNSFIASVRFLEEKGLAKTVSRPTLTTIDNIPATASVGQSGFIVGANNAQASSAQVQAMTALAITPHVIFHKDYNDIKLNIALLDGDFPTYAGAINPLTIQGSINSQAVLKEGQSLLLASYNREKEETYTNKVPFLGDIPLLGWFFKSSGVKKTKVTTLYLVTPKIIWTDNLNSLRLKESAEINGHTVKININDAQIYESSINASHSTEVDSLISGLSQN